MFSSIRNINYITIAAQELAVSAVDFIGIPKILVNPFNGIRKHVEKNLNY